MPDDNKPNPLANLGRGPQPAPAVETSNGPAPVESDGLVNTQSNEQDSLDNTTDAPSTKADPAEDKSPEAKRELAKSQFQTQTVTSETGDDSSNGESKIYTSAPRDRLKIGKFQFENSLLTLKDPAKIAEFESLLDKLPGRERSLIRTVDRKAAERMARARGPAAVQGFADSSVGRQQERIGGGKTIGDEPVASTSLVDGAKPEAWHKGVEAPNVADEGGNAVQEDGSTR